ncbi:MAG: alpha-galactosidase [Clostridia bacterium]|nr:alpha-galactosidase [Clostridia bacterium]
MKRNGMCPICYIKQFLGFKKRVSKLEINEDYRNDICPTPPMGWSSWNTFRNEIDENLFKQTGKAMVDKGLLAAGYKYINLDDNWHSNLRDDEGKLQGDLVRFKHGIPALVKELNAMGLKVGIYSSNGVYTCESLPASLHHEWIDAKTFADWGIEYFKYDYCHHEIKSKYAPLVTGISIMKGDYYQEIDCLSAKCEGVAKIMPDSKVKCRRHISGLDAGLGAATFDNVYVEEDAEYVLTVHIRKRGNYEKFLQVGVNGENFYFIDFPPQMPFNNTARFQTKVELKKGINVVKLSNPIRNRADGAFYQYYNMGQCLKRATEGKKPIVFSICEWGFNKPYMWGAKAGNLWRTTPDIRPIWPWIKIIYNQTVKRYKYAGIGSYNDPDMLEVGNGKLTLNENRAHFTLWCMMNAPLILGNDIRSMPDSVLEIVTKKELIALNQDPLGKPCKRIRKGPVDILVKPLANGSTAICFFNKGILPKKSRLSVDSLAKDEYINFPLASQYETKELWTGERDKIVNTLSCSTPGHSVKVFVVSPCQK